MVRVRALSYHCVPTVSPLWPLFRPILALSTNFGTFRTHFGLIWPHFGLIFTKKVHFLTTRKVHFLIIRKVHFLINPKSALFCVQKVHFSGFLVSKPYPIPEGGAFLAISLKTVKNSEKQWFLVKKCIFVKTL